MTTTESEFTCEACAAGDHAATHYPDQARCRDFMCLCGLAQASAEARAERAAFITSLMDYEIVGLEEGARLVVSIDHLEDAPRHSGWDGDTPPPTRWHI